MKSSIIETLMISFINKGLKINTIRTKMRRFASQSALCKMYLKLVRKVVTKTITLANNGTVINSDFASFAAGDYVAIHYVKNWLESYSRVNGINTKMVVL